MHFLFLVIAGIVSGIFAGMGMGGGTFLVPILSVIFGYEQIICQSTNVICFVFLAVICAVIYTKNKLVNFYVVLCVCIPSILISVICTVFALKIKSSILHTIFACFVIGIGVYFLVQNVVSLIKKKR